eukprot:scaffold22669_cov141-Cylindrotheca_fusiformis.AAC.1
MKRNDQSRTNSRKNGKSHQSRSITTGPESDCSTGGDTPDPSSPHQQENIPLGVATSEKKTVVKVKILVAFILILAVGAVATITYLLVESQEKANFENQ